MDSGQLADKALADVLQELADQRATGELVVHGPDGESGRIDLRDGLVTGASAQVPALAARLVSGAALTPEVLDFLEHGTPAGLPSNEESARLLAEYGCAGALELSSALTEMVHDSVRQLCDWDSGSWELRPASARAAGSAAAVVDLLPRLEQRRREWASLAAVLGGAEATPRWAGTPTCGRLDGLSSESWALLCRIDGNRRLCDLALECGFTLLEAARALLALVSRGLVVVPAPVLDLTEPRVLTNAGVHSGHAAPAPIPDAPTAAPPPPREPADTASLLRELSSLGLEDEPVVPARPAGLAGRVPQQDRKGKRRTLFSR